MTGVMLADRQLIEPAATAMLCQVPGLDFEYSPRLGLGFCKTWQLQLSCRCTFLLPLQSAALFLCCLFHSLRQLSGCCLNITRNQQKHQGTATLHDMSWFSVSADSGMAWGMSTC